MSIFQGLHIVTNNSPTSVGDGGEPRQPLRPALCCTSGSRENAAGTELHVSPSDTELGRLHFGSCEGGALPVIMSITGPRETHDYLRNI